MNLLEASRLDFKRNNTYLSSKRYSYIHDDIHINKLKNLSFTSEILQFRREDLKLFEKSVKFRNRSLCSGFMISMIIRFDEFMVQDIESEFNIFKECHMYQKRTISSHKLN